MSHHPDVPTSEELQEYYEGVQAPWPNSQTSPFMAVNHPYCTEPLVPPSVLTPISLPDSSFRPSPALSHHAHDYRQDYQYTLNDPISAPQGLGISAPFPSNFPQTSAPNAAYMYAPAPTDLPHSMIQTPAQSPSAPPPSKRVRRTSHTPSRDQQCFNPINIAPNPEGIMRMEHDRRVSQISQPSQPSPPVYTRPRAPGRGRRDPEAETEDAFVEELRMERVSWKNVRAEFIKRFQKDASEARLQMRFLRRKRERMARWEDSDVELLIHAVGIWERDKFQFLSDKIKELGATRLYSADQCRTQLRLLEEKEQQRSVGSPSAMSDPAPTTPIVSRKRARAQSLELECHNEEDF
ncbi:uncharacterized protein N7515_007054 [Penicillium bovifimosum]|uniref:Myb-like domain-containing protein n=1 Tax=Penicillium bovifimosum TaxID=126998 RepID=A0A9W9L1R4_9EURO|nr:uncharacterized protein N7515_007054 [Penicillium bovifimosum]KAJ5131015.1 hypothetical protein N7515_007054 [Penicillium bovifimosum]